MKKRAIQFSIAAGLFIWFWAGSYLWFRNHNNPPWIYRALPSTPTFGPGVVMLPPARLVWIPEKLSWLKPVYFPMAQLDSASTGSPVEISIEHGFNFRIGYKF